MRVSADSLAAMLRHVANGGFNVKPDTSEMRAATMKLLSELQPVSMPKLKRRLRKDYGASEREANTTILKMIGEGAIRRTFFGKLKLP
jgi:hypothetical protein